MERRAPGPTWSTQILAIRYVLLPGRGELGGQQGSQLRSRSAVARLAAEELRMFAADEPSDVLCAAREWKFRDGCSRGKAAVAPLLFRRAALGSCLRTQRTHSCASLGFVHVPVVEEAAILASPRRPVLSAASLATSVRHLDLLRAVPRIRKSLCPLRFPCSFFV